MFLRAAHRPCSKSKERWKLLALNSSARQRIGQASGLRRRRRETNGESPSGIEFNTAYADQISAGMPASLFMLRI